VRIPTLAHGSPSVVRTLGHGSVARHRRPPLPHQPWLRCSPRAAGTPTHRQQPHVFTGLSPVRSAVMGVIRIRVCPYLLPPVISVQL